MTSFTVGLSKMVWCAALAASIAYFWVITHVLKLGSV